MLTTQPRPKTCSHCGTTFHPQRMAQRVCGPVCAGRAVRAARKEKLAAERKQTKERREKLKTIPQRIKEAQYEFNRYIRLRDRSAGCFVCGSPFPVGQLGGDFDAGHVRSRGAAGHLRFNEDNCHGECKSCNSSTGAKPHEIKAGAIRRIGQDRFDALENDNNVFKWNHAELIEIKRYYREKCKELEAA